jgi:hypothetical protein
MSEVDAGDSCTTLCNATDLYALKWLTDQILGYKCFIKIQNKAGSMFSGVYEVRDDHLVII